MCWGKKKKDDSDKDESPLPTAPPPPPLSETPEKKPDNEGSKKSDGAAAAAGSKKTTKSLQGPSLKEDNTQVSEQAEGDTPKENGEPPKKMPQPKSNRLKAKTDFWKDEDPLKMVSQFRSGTEAVDDAEFGWADGKTGGLKRFPCGNAEKEVPFADTKEMKAQEVEYKASMKRRVVQLEMTQSSKMGIAAELRTKTQEAC